MCKPRAVCNLCSCPRSQPDHTCGTASLTIVCLHLSSLSSLPDFFSNITSTHSNRNVQEFDAVLPCSTFASTAKMDSAEQP
ncbi:hypothetical protein L211DRAFT_489206 [Terfezia boudieri ATCC MYA-4762]|uniref:Uncharacterized protein n=1 Tax=Terfezia boudieri ATCC MYA-4762 TaxID=1051890 RepID=A0A3N4LHF5_9PEZI|nr:hypothetical protein L211DRAFT_489206 [Terfezia boudieri ATCC MYA-4762]